MIRPLTEIMSGWEYDPNGKEWKRGDRKVRHHSPRARMVEAPEVGEARVLEKATPRRQEGDSR